MQKTHDEAHSPRALVLLWIGAALGLALALTNLASRVKNRSKHPLSPGVVAVVNGVPILRSDYNTALAAIGESEHRPVSDENRRTVLKRLIDDELLLEYGLELGLVRADPTTREALLSAVFAAERARGDEALTAKLDELRKAASVRVFPELP